MALLEGLSEVDWSALSHAYGTATDVPDQLRALASADRDARHEALSALNLNVIHQSSHWPGCVEVVPFLFELVLSPAVAERGAIAGYLQTLAFSMTRPYLSSPPSPPDPASLTGKDEQLWRRTFVAIRDRVSSLLPLLADPDPSVRAGVAFLIAWFPTVDADDALRERLDDPDENVVASAALALGFRRQYAPRLLVLAAQTEKALARAAAAIALGWLGRRDEVMDAIEQAIRNPPDAEGLHWTSSITELVYEVVRPLGAETPPAIIEALTKRYRDDHHGDDHLAGMLLGWAFPGGPGQPERLPEDLNSAQADIVFKVLAKSSQWPLYTDVLKGYGLPATARRLALFMGKEPADLLETRITFESSGPRWWPLWKCLLVTGRALEGGTAALEDKARELASALGVEQLAWLAVWDVVEMELPWEADLSTELHELTTRALALALGDDRLTSLATQYLARRRTSEGIIEGWQLDAFLRACVLGMKAQQRGVLLDSSFDPMLVQAVRHAPAREPLHDVLRSLGSERLEPIIVASLRPPFVLSEYVWIRLGCWRFLDLCPTPAVVSAACALLETVAIRYIVEPDVVAFFASQPSGVLSELAANGGTMTKAMALRAQRHVRGGAMTNAEVRAEITQRFWEGVQLSSFDTEGEGLDPCPLCGAVYWALGLAELPEGSRGCILAPNGEGDAEGVRARTELSGGFLREKIGSKDGQPPASDAAVLEVIAEVLARGTASEHASANQACSELGALHLLAREIRG